MKKLGGAKIAKWLGGTKSKLAKALGAKSGMMQTDLFAGAPPPENQVQLENAPYLPGFEKMFARSMG